MPRPFVCIALGLALAGCNGGTTVSIDTTDDGDGNAVVSTDANGHVEIKAPGLSGSIKLPKAMVGAEDFEVDGIKLYPGSKLRNARAASRDGGGKVTIEFESPAAPPTVRDWFRDNMTKQGFKVMTEGDNLTGTNDDGEPFLLRLDDAGGGKSTGRLQIGR